MTSGHNEGVERLAIKVIEVIKSKIANAESRYIEIMCDVMFAICCLCSGHQCANVIGSLASDQCAALQQCQVGRSILEMINNGTKIINLGSRACG